MSAFTLSILAIIEESTDKYVVHLDSQAAYYPVLREHALAKCSDPDSAPEQALSAYFSRLTSRPISKAVGSTVISILGATRNRGVGERFFYALEVSASNQLRLTRLTPVEFYTHVFHAI